MKRTDAPDFAPGNLFTDGDPAAPSPASVLDASWLNMMQEEVANVVEGGGLVLDPGDDTQLLQAIRILIARGQGAFWCGVSAGPADAQVVVLPASLLAVPDGTAIGWKIGPGLTNPGAVTLTIGGLGTFALRKDGPLGPIPLAGGELVAGNIAIGRIDGATLQLTATEMGTASLANASANTGVVAAVQGGVVPGNIAVFSDALGTVVDSGVTGIGVGATVYVAAPRTLVAGAYLVDTFAGPFACNLPAAPALGTVITLTDARATWNPNNLTLARNGQTIMGLAQDLVCNVEDQTFTIWFNGLDWRLL